VKKILGEPKAALHSRSDEPPRNEHINFPNRVEVLDPFPWKPYLGSFFG